MKTPALTITIPLFGRSWSVQYAPEFHENGKTTGSLSGYGSLTDLLRDHPEYAGLPVIDFQHSEGAKADMKSAWNYPLSRLPQYADRAEDVEPFLAAYLQHLSAAGVVIYPAGEERPR